MHTRVRYYYKSTCQSGVLFFPKIAADLLLADGIPHALTALISLFFCTIFSEFCYRLGTKVIVFVTSLSFYFECQFVCVCCVCIRILGLDNNLAFLFISLL